MTTLGWIVTVVALAANLFAYILIRAADAVSFQHTIGAPPDNRPAAQVIDLDTHRHNRHPGQRHA